VKRQSLAWHRAGRPSSVRILVRIDATLSLA
jgi:hypothetical protein